MADLPIGEMIIWLLALVDEEQKMFDGRPADGMGLSVRIIHLLAAMALVGGAAFQRFVLLPAARRNPEEFSPTIAAAMRGKWAAVVGATSGLLLLSGLYTFIVAVKTLVLPPQYHMMFGIKFLLALYLFFMASFLAGRTAIAERLRQRADFWLSVNLSVAVIVVTIASMMKAMPKLEKLPNQPPNAVAGERL
jgi:hypothetical protein